MLSIRGKGGESGAVRSAASVNLWKRATSLGGTESLIEHRASIEGDASTTPKDLLRLSVGLEDVPISMRISPRHSTPGTGTSPGNARMANILILGASRGL